MANTENWSRRVESEQQPDRDTHRLILFSQDRSNVLLLGEKAGFLLPSVEIPRWQRVAENLTSATRNEWGCVAISLFASEIGVPRDDSKGHCYQAMECVCGGEKHASNTAWKSIRSLTRGSFQEEADYQALQRFHPEANSYQADPASPFARRGWFAELRSWVTEAIEPLGLHRSGAFRQFNASPSFSLIRLETNGPAVWFKAVGEPNLREFPITLKLAQLFPDYLPRIIGEQPAWNGWLSLEARGTQLSETKKITDWTEAAGALARLQVESIGNTSPIAAAGAHDARLAQLRTLVDPFLAVIARLMERQAKVPPAVLGLSELALLRARLHDSLSLLAELGIPDALGHWDLNPGNVIVSPEGCVFLDWAEAYVGCPFLSFEYLLEHFRRTNGGETCVESQLADSYWKPWKELVPTSVFSEARRFIPLVAAFAYAASTGVWGDQKELDDSRVAGYLRSLARRMNYEATQLTV
jgi:hypothetical protein